MLFTYWHSTDLAVIAESIAHWRTTFPDFRVVDDAEVEAILQRSFRDYLGMYRRLRIPAARSDVARLATLHAHGGFYADCHFAMIRTDEARRFVEAPAAPVVLLARTALATEVPGLRPLNGLMCAAAGHPLLAQALARGLENLARRMAEEDRRDAEGAYDIFELIGARNLRAVLLADPFTLRAEFTGQVRLAAEDEAPFRRNVFKSYQGPGAHWSERQRCEPLFLPPG